MKNNKLILTILFSMLLVTCEQIEEIENFAISHRFEQSVQIDLIQTDPAAFEISLEIDANSNSDFKSNSAKISDYSINEVSFHVPSFEGNEKATLHGTIKFTDGNSVLGAPVDLGNINMYELYTSGEVNELVLSETLKKAIEKNLLEHHSVFVELEGNISNKPIKAELKFAMEIEALVDVN